jgi:hypothetical protein
VRAKAIAGALALGAIVALVLPVGAAAATRRVHQPALAAAELRFRASHGFRISLEAPPGSIVTVAIRR